MNSAKLRSGAVRVTQGADKIATYDKTPRSYRKRCTPCGGRVFAEHLQWLGQRRGRRHSRVSLQGGVHVNYQETVLRIRDGLPKLKDIPTETDGSGVVVPE